jgi:hypothetical protein
MVRKLLAGKPIFSIMPAISFSISGAALASAGDILGMMKLSFV